MKAQDSFSNPIDNDIYHLFELIGINKNVSYLTDQTVDYLRQQNPEVPSSVWTKIKTDQNHEGYVKQLTDIYKLHYSHTEIKELIVFFESPIGKKYINKAGVIGNESYNVGKSYGRELGQMIVNQISKAGY